MTPLDVDEAQEYVEVLRALLKVVFPPRHTSTLKPELQLRGIGSPKISLGEAPAAVVYRALYDLAVMRLEELNVDLEGGVL